MPTAQVKVAQMRGKWPTNSISSSSDAGVLEAFEKSDKACPASVLPASAFNARSHSVSNAFPCAMLALLATGQRVHASSVESKSCSWLGEL